MNWRTGMLRNSLTPDDRLRTPRSSGSGEHSTRVFVDRFPRALVIDDSNTARAKTSKVLYQAGCRVCELPSAIGATRVALRENIEVAIVDISLPGLSGDKLVSVFRRNSRLRNMTVIVVGQAEDQLEEVARNPEVDGVLVKSQVQHALVPMLQRLLPQKRLMAIAGA